MLHKLRCKSARHSGHTQFRTQKYGIVYSFLLVPNLRRWGRNTSLRRCRHLGLLRNYLAEGDCAAGVVSLVIPGYAGVWGFDLDQFQVYARFILLDSITGYRSQYQGYATIVKAT